MHLRAGLWANATLEVCAKDFSNNWELMWKLTIDWNSQLRLFNHRHMSWRFSFSRCSQQHIIQSKKTSTCLQRRTKCPSQQASSKHQLPRSQHSCEWAWMLDVHPQSSSMPWCENLQTHQTLQENDVLKSSKSPHFLPQRTSDPSASNQFWSGWDEPSWCNRSEIWQSLMDEPQVQTMHHRSLDCKVFF